jgi:hypothetical protein
MRTTLTIDDDIAAILKRETKRKGISFKVLVNASLRRGLAAEQILPPRNEVKTRPHSFGFKPGIDLDKLNQLVDELEVESVATNHRSASA